MDDKLLEILNSVLADIGVDELTSLDPNLTLREDLELDSISLVELTVKLDNTFNANVNEAGMIATIGDIQNRIKEASKS